jgi:hypothetical protein
LLFGCQRHELPTEVTGGGALTEEFGDATLDAIWVGMATMAGCHCMGDGFEPLANRVDGPLALFLTDLLICAAEDEQDATRDVLLFFRIRDVIAENR